MDQDKQYEQALFAANKAISLDREDAYAHASLGFALSTKDPGAAIRAFKQAFSINPNLAVAHFGLGIAYISGGQPEDAKPHLETAIRLSPRDPLSHVYAGIMGVACFALGDLEGAIEWSSTHGQGSHPTGRIGTMRMAALALLGRDAEAARELELEMELIPHLSIAHAVATNPGMGQAYAEGLRKAGLPEE
jgi:tetratricopeptide (TPR) repeat protein